MLDSYPRKSSLIGFLVTVQSLVVERISSPFNISLFLPQRFVFLIFFSQRFVWCLVTFKVLPVDRCLYEGNVSLPGWQGCISILIFSIDEYDTPLQCLWYSAAGVLSDVIMLGHQPWAKHPKPQQRATNIRALWRCLCLILQYWLHREGAGSRAHQGTQVCLRSSHPTSSSVNFRTFDNLLFLTVLFSVVPRSL